MSRFGQRLTVEMVITLWSGLPSAGRISMWVTMNETTARGNIGGSFISSPECFFFYYGELLKYQ